MDFDFINTSQNFSDSSEKEPYKISDEQEAVIRKSWMEIENGNFHKNEDVISEMRKWLKDNLSS